MTRRRSRSLTLAAATLAALLLAAVASADDGSRADVRVERSCTAQSSVRLRVRAEDDDPLRVDIDVRTPRGGAKWVVSVVHERRLARSVTRRTRSSGSFSVRFTMADWPGPDTVVARAVGPRGEVCRAAVTVDVS